MILQDIPLYVWGIVAFAASLAINLTTDYGEILTKGKVDHTSKWPWIRKALISLPSVLLFAWELSDDTKWLWCLLFSGLMVSVMFYITFDPFLNLLRGYGFFYGGTKDDWDSLPERLLERPFKAWLTFAIKLLLAFASVYIYIKLL